MAKITKQEFENWSKKFDKIIYNHILNNSLWIKKKKMICFKLE